MGAREQLRRARVLLLRPGVVFRSPRLASTLPTFASALRGPLAARRLRQARLAARAIGRASRAAGRFLRTPPMVGALYVLALTAQGATEPMVSDRERVLGDHTSRITAWVVVRYAGTIRGVALELALVALLFGAALGWASGLALPARAGRSPFVRAGKVLALTAILHAALFAWSMDRHPQLYDTWYAQGGAWRRAELLVTGVASPSKFLAVGAAVFAVVVAVSRPRVPRAWLRWLPFAAAALALLALAQTPRCTPSVRAQDPKRPNVVILAADSFRNDHVDPALTPHLAELASHGTRFSRAYVTIARTFPSWTTILTGRYPHHHGIRTTLPRHEDRDHPFDTMAARFRKAGWATGVVADYGGDVFQLADLGFDVVDAPRVNFTEFLRVRGFERARAVLPILHSPAGRRVFPTMRELPKAADADFLAGDAVDVVRSLADRPFFLVVFFAAPHFPYAAPAPYYRRFVDPRYGGEFPYEKGTWATDRDHDARNIEHVRGLYKGAVASVDDAAARVLGELRRDGLDRNTIVVVAADHGEDLFEGGRWQGHGDHLFGDEQNHIPLIISDPRRQGPSGNVAPDLVHDVDLAPTLCELAGVEPPPLSDGVSLVPAMNGTPLEPRLLFGETGMWMGDGFPAEWRIPYPPFVDTVEVDSAHDEELVLRSEYVPIINFAKHRMVFDGRWKLIYMPTTTGPKYRLFDTVADPENATDRSADEPDVALRLRVPLWKWMLDDPKMEERRGFVAPRGVHIDEVDGVLTPSLPPR